MAEASTTDASSVNNLHRVSRARLFIRVLGISFFSILSVVIAFFAFTQLPQVQDLLLDARPYWSQEIIYLVNFYVVGIFVWALPLVFTARLLLLQNFERIGIDTEERFKFYIFAMPRFYAVIGFVAVLLGMITASKNLPSPAAGDIYEYSLRAFLAFHLVILCISTLCITAIIMMRDIFISLYRRRMEAIERRDPKGCREALMRIESFSGKPCPKQENDIHLTSLKPEFLSTQTWIAAQRAKLFMWIYMCGLGGLLLTLAVIHFLSYSDMFKGMFVTPDLSSYPSLQAIWDFLSGALSLRRAPLLFVLLGAWLPFLSILALLSNRHQFPFITAYIIAGILLAQLVGDGHEIRVEELSKEQRAELKPVAFGDAVREWKAASGWDAKGCEQLPAGAPALLACPRPIIVAGEGGGSRAAFLLASVLGAIEDDSLDKQKNQTGRPFHQQLFAISSVSGSSLGAAFFVSALKVQPKLPGAQLKKALYRQRNWFPNVATAKPVEISTSGAKSASTTPNFLTSYVGYKDSLQAALSNDFLSPTLAAWLVRDVSLASMFPYVMDRGGVLETSWEDSFNDVYGTSRETSPLSGPLQAMAPAPGHWMPLIFMNATSIETGRRIIATPVRITEPLADGKPLFADTYDLHELMCAPYIDPVTKRYPPLSTFDEITSAVPSMFVPDANCMGKKPTSIDIRLSTAASVSSRSPFVTPHGTVRDRRAELLDSALDGAYFDNSGIVTALDIADGLKAFDKRLLPFILQVSNEPAWFEPSKNCLAEANYPATPQIPDETGSPPLSSLTDLLTVNSTRISRGYQTILELPERASHINGGILSAAQIHVCPQPQGSFWSLLMNYMEEKENIEAMQENTPQHRGFKAVSLSWWLSPPLQAFLDQQIYDTHNLAERNCIISLLMDDPAGGEVCKSAAGS